MNKEFLLTKAGGMIYKFLFFNGEYADYFFNNLDKNVIVELENSILFVDRAEGNNEVFWAGNTMEDVVEALNQLTKELGVGTELSIRCGEDKTTSGQLHKILPVLLSSGGKKIYHNIGYKSDHLEFQHPVNLVSLPDENDTPPMLDLAYNTLGKDRFDMDLNDMKSYLNEKDKCAFVIKFDNELAGLVLGSIYNQGRSVFVRGLSISETYRGKGLSNQLLSKLFLWGKENGAQNSMLWVQDSNHTARKLYEKFGYYPYGDEEVLVQYTL